ncbi:MAG TPA: extracellular solute-binding protein [Candidatus Limnocylindrales bacterium]
MTAAVPDRSASGLGRARTRGFLFADLRGYTEYVEGHGDAAAAALLERYRLLVRAAVAAHEGAEVRTEGDSVYVVFPAVGAAVACALDIVERAAETSDGTDGVVRVGVGVHAGETVETAEGLVGSAVNIAARVCGQAAAGEALVTDTVRALTRTSLDVRFEPRGAPRLKGVSEPIPLFAVAHGAAYPATAGTAPPARNPYKGLRAFGEPDSADFFGREALTAQLVERLADVARRGRLLTVVGPSGSGKSSVVRAGLVPALRRGALPGSDGWRIAAMFPGARPFAELAAALRSVADGPLRALDDLGRGADVRRAVEAVLGPHDGRLLLVIDQLEELFALVRDEAERDRFLDSLAAALSAPGSRLLAVVTVRADFLDPLLLWPGLGELVRTGLEAVTPLSRAELELAIARPAQGAGLELEPGLTAEVIADVATRPAALPLLQYALTELFERSDGRRLTRSGYAAIGGVIGALGRRAEETYAALGAEAREVVRQALLRLVATGDGGAPTGRRVRLAELRSGLGDEARLDEVLHELGRSRLLSFDRDGATGEPTVEIAHEALLAGWPRLAGWIEKERGDIWTRRRLDDATAEWERADRDPSYLVTGGRLELFDGWARSTDLGLSGSERAFLDESRAERGRQAQTEAARAAHERILEKRAERQLQGLVAVFATATLVAGSLLVVVFGQGQAAGEQEAIARGRELAAASVGNLQADPTLSLLLAVEAAQATTDRGYVTQEALDSLHWALQAAPVGYPVRDAPVATRPGPAGETGVFLLPPEQLVELARNRAGRTLSASECLTYLHRPCATGGAAGTGSASLAVYTGSGRVPVARLATGTVSGTRVRIVLPDQLAPAVDAFGAASGIGLVRVDLDETALESGGAGLPDVALVARSSLVATLARSGRLVELSQVVEPAVVRSRLGPYLYSVATVARSGGGTTDGTGLYGLPVAASVDDLVWYQPAAFRAAGYTVPTTFDELAALSGRIVADGGTPWCLGLAAASPEDGAAGSAAAEWVEDLLLGGTGVASFERWTAGEVSFTDPAVRAAFERFGRVAFGQGFILGGLASAQRTPRSIAAWPLAQAPGRPACWLYRGSGTDRRSWPLSVSRALSAFPFPAADARYADALRGEVYTLVVFHDRPEVRQLVRYLAGDPFAAELQRTPGATGIVALAPIGSAAATAAVTGRDDVDRLQERLLRAALDAGTFRVAASGTMPAARASAFAAGMLRYLDEGPAWLDRLLSDLQSGARGSGAGEGDGEGVALGAVVTFDGTSCTYRGPAVVPAGSRLEVRFETGETRQHMSVRAIRAKDGTSWADVIAPWKVSYIMPAWSGPAGDLNVVSGTGTGTLALEAASGFDSLVLACMTSDRKFTPGALLRVVTP